MEKYIIGAIILYLLFFVCYLLWEWSVKRRRNAARGKGFYPFKAPPKEDIIGKSQFVLRHSKPQAATLIQSDKREENTNIFADGNAKDELRNTPAAIPLSELDRVFSSETTEDDPGKIDLEIEDGPEEEVETEDDGGDVDTGESEDADEPAGTSMATGLDFNDLSGMLQAVENHETATPQEREEAGRVITEIRRTDMFEQIVSGQPQKKVAAGKLMDDYLDAYYRRMRESDETPNEPSVKAPKDFDPRAFA